MRLQNWVSTVLSLVLHTCALVGSCILDASTLVFCIGCALDMQLILALLLIELRVWMILAKCNDLLLYIPCVQLVISLMKVLFVRECFKIQVYMCKCFIPSRIRCEWVLPLFPNSRLSLEFVIGCFVTE